MTALLLVLAALATYRLTRLVTADRITEPIRSRIEDRSEFAGYLVTCDWCLSIWIAPLPATAVVLWPDNRVVLVALVALSLSALTGIASLVEGLLDR